VEHSERVTLRNIEIDRMAVQALVDVYTFLHLANSTTSVGASPFFKLTECKRVLDLSCGLRMLCTELQILSHRDVMIRGLSLKFVQQLDKHLRFRQAVPLKVKAFGVNLLVSPIDVPVAGINATI
jgi:hypothetical protein